MSVAFDDLPGQDFPLRFREVATKADSKTHTFQVTYTMDRLDDIKILPGMTATVTADLSRVTQADSVFSVPSSAIVGDYKLDPRAWVLSEATMTVAPRPVKVGRLSGANIAIREGLASGDRIVVAGTPFLVDDVVRNLGQVEVGDVMVIRSAERLAVKLYAAKTATMGRVEKTEVSRAALGEKHHGTISKTIKLTGRVAEINEQERIVTLEGKNARMNIAIDNGVDVSAIKVGDMVTAEYLESVALTIQTRRNRPTDSNPDQGAPVC